MTAEVCGKPYWVGVSRATVTTDGKQRRCINTIKRTRGIALTIDPANICLNLILPRDVREARTSLGVWALHKGPAHLGSQMGHCTPMRVKARTTQSMILPIWHIQNFILTLEDKVPYSELLMWSSPLRFFCFHVSGSSS